MISRDWRRQKLLLIIVGLNIWSGVEAIITLGRLAVNLYNYGFGSETNFYFLTLIPYVVLSILLIANAYGYWNRCLWAWYLTFPQILVSLLWFHPTVYFLIYLERLTKSSVVIYILMGLVLVAELAKGLFLYSKNVKEEFLENAPLNKLRYWKRFTITTTILFFVVVGLFLMFRLHNIFFGASG